MQPQYCLNLNYKKVPPPPRPLAPSSTDGSPSSGTDCLRLVCLASASRIRKLLLFLAADDRRKATFAPFAPTRLKLKWARVSPTVGSSLVHELITFPRSLANDLFSRADLEGHSAFACLVGWAYGL